MMDEVAYDRGVDAEPLEQTPITDGGEPPFHWEQSNTGLPLSHVSIQFVGVSEKRPLES